MSDDVRSGDREPDLRPPSWWPDDAEAWTRAVVRAGVRSSRVEVEFDGLVVRAAPDGRVVGIDVLDPRESPPRAALDRRVLLGIAAVAAALVAAEWLGYDGAAFLAGILIAAILAVTFLRLGDERPVRRLAEDDGAGVVDVHALLRRREQFRGSDHVEGRRRLHEAHRLLWDLADEPDAGRADELRRRHAALAEEPEPATSGAPPSAPGTDDPRPSGTPGEP